MGYISRVDVITGTSPASATSALVGAVMNGLQRYDWFTVDAIIIGGTGGTIDVTIQRKIGNLPNGTAVDLWVDWLRFPQVAAATTTKFSVNVASTNDIYTVGMVATAAFTATLAADTSVGGHPGNSIRVVATAGAGTSAGAVQTVYVTMWNAKS